MSISDILSAHTAGLLTKDEARQAVLNLLSIEGLVTVAVAA